MKEIRNIDLTKVNNGAHQMFMENVAKVLAEYQQAITAHPKTKTLTEAFGKLLQQEKTCMGLSRTSLRTAQIAEADHDRDIIFTGFKAILKAYMKGFNGEAKAAAKVIWNEIAGYRINNRMQLEQQTGMLYSLLKRCQTQHAEQIKMLQLTRYVAQLDEANNKVSQLLNLRLDEQKWIAKGALRATRRQIDAQYRLIVEAINARMFLNDDESVAPIADFINEMVRRYKREIIPHSKNKKGNEADNASNGQTKSPEEGDDAAGNTPESPTTGA